MKNLATIVLLFLCSSCAWTAEEFKTAYPSWTDEQIEIVVNGQIYVGMPEEQMRASWGSPNYEHFMQSRFGTTKFLYYHYRVIHIRGGVVASINSSSW